MTKLILYTSLILFTSTLLSQVTLEADRIGIRTDLPNTLLHINGIGVDNDGSTAVVRIVSGNGSQNLLLDGNEIDATADGLFLNSNSGQNVTIANGGGNVGIGTPNPNTLLHINGTGVDNDGSTAVVRIVSGNGSQNLLLDGNEIDATGDGLFLNNNTNQNVIIANGGGNVGIGISNPTFQLELSGSAGKPGGGSWSNSSDIRLKKNISDYSDGLASILNIRPVRYQYNEKSGFNTEESYVGVIAQELEKVAPYMVGENEVDGQKYLTVDNSGMTYMLINAVKEQQSVIEQQQSEMEYLKEEVSLLKQMILGNRKTTNSDD